jgi:N-acetylneuraminate synthase
MSSVRTFVIAEAGVNHNGSLELAFELVDAAKAAGADAVKFQSFHAEELVSRHARKASYQERTTGEGESQLAMVKRLELDEAQQRAVAAHASERGIRFMSTPFDLRSLAFLLELGVSPIKISSGDVTYAPLLRAIGGSGRPAILSTGMCTLADVEAALAVLGAGYAESTGEADAFRRRVTVLHCTTEYPAPLDAVNLRAMDTMREAFGLPVGYSDHTQGIAVAIAAVARGACVIEKHFTMDRGLEGPDHAASLEPSELKAMIDGIRAVEACLGTGEKVPAPAEIPNMAVARRSLVAARAIERGETFTTENLTAKRPGTGISAIRYDEWIGKTAERDYEEDELL